VLMTNASASGVAPDHPTPFPAVNTVALDFLAGVQRILGDQFRAMYLSGSLALGDFSADRSDIDFIVVTEDEVSGAHFPALQTLHACFNASDSSWATEVEAAYIPLAALRRYDPAHARHPHIQRGADEALVWDQLATDWVLQRFILREYGVIVAGPPPDILIDPVPADDLRRAVVALMRHVWWARMPDDPTPLRHRGYQAYVALTMCRILYTLDIGAVVSKPVAARWARIALPTQWNALIERAQAWRKEDQHIQDGDVEETVALLRYAQDRCQHWEQAAATQRERPS